MTLFDIITTIPFGDILSFAGVIISVCVSVGIVRYSSRNARYAAMLDNKREAIHNFLVAANNAINSTDPDLLELENIGNILNLYIGHPQKEVKDLIHILRERANDKWCWEEKQRKAEEKLEQPPCIRESLSCSNFYKYTTDAEKIFYDISNLLSYEIRESIK